MDKRRNDIGIFRYSVISPALDESLTSSQRGVITRNLSQCTHHHPNGADVVISRATIDRWIRLYRHGGFESLLPKKTARALRCEPELIDLAVCLKRQAPARTAAQICRLIVESKGTSPSARTLQRHFRHLGLNRPGSIIAYGRFEAEAVNDRWIGDGLHGPIINNSKAILIAFIDDYSRTLCGYQWVLMRGENVFGVCKALRRGLSSRGVPRSIYVDNGSAFSSRHLMRPCAVLGIHLIHSRVRKPQGRGKIERFFRSVRDQFLVEVPHSSINSIDDLNTRFDSWVEQVYHQSIHSEIGVRPIERFNSQAPYPCPSLGELKEAFLWSETRTVTKTALVSLLGNSYEVNAALVGRKIEMVFDPTNLEKIDVRFGGNSFGFAKPYEIKTHCHPKVVDLLPKVTEQTGIDYLSLLLSKNESQWMAPGNQIVSKTSFSDLIPSVDASQIPGQMQINCEMGEN